MAETRRLYRAMVGTVVMVVAENEADASVLARVAARKEVGEVTAIHAVTSQKEIPEEWRDGLPYPPMSLAQEHTIEWWFEHGAPVQS